VVYSSCVDVLLCTTVLSVTWFYIGPVLRAGQRVSCSGLVAVVLLHMVVVPLSVSSVGLVDTLVMVCTTVSDIPPGLPTGHQTANSI